MFIIDVFLCYIQRSVTTSPSESLRGGVFAFQGCVGAILFTVVSGCNEPGAVVGGGALKHIQVPVYCEFLGYSMVLFPAGTFQEIHVIGKRDVAVSGGGMLLGGPRFILSPPASVGASNGKSGLGHIPLLGFWGILRSPYLPTRSQSLYRLSYSAHLATVSYI